MTSSNKNSLIELEELIGKDNLEILMCKYGGGHIYIPRTAKYDKRVEYLKNVHYMRDYLDYNISVDEIVFDNCLTDYQQRFLKGLVKFCFNRHIRSYKELLQAVQPFSGKRTEEILLLIGAGAFTALLEQYSGKSLYIPHSKESEPYLHNSQNTDLFPTKVFFDLSDGLSFEETAKKKITLNEVKRISKIYGIGSVSDRAK